MLTQEKLKSILRYDSETGIFHWLQWRHGRRLSLEAGAYSCVTGYISIYIEGKSYYAHRLAWLYIYGIWPTHQIDHDDRVRHHNWISNLLDRTQAQNMVNTELHPDKGIEKLSSGSFRVKMSNKTIGTFKNIEDARNAYGRARAAKLESKETTGQLVDQLGGIH